MKYGIFADIHANLEALEAVLGFLRFQRVEHYISLGDLVGYGHNPNECVDIVRTLTPLTGVVGNHDWAACGLKDITWFNEYAQKAIIWTRQSLSQENQIYLSELPKVASEDGFTLVHGSLQDPLDEYLLTREQFAANLPYLNTPLLLVGHSHIPFVFGEKFTQILRNSDSLVLPEQGKCIINPGAVGQPRDGNNKASCGIYDSDTGRFHLYRVEYNISITQEKMRKARLPGFLIERLSWGK
jgi:predicted phosphodiesterase